MTWSPGDFARPQWFNWNKWFRRTFIPVAIALLAGLAAFLRWWAIPFLLRNWPWG